MKKLIIVIVIILCVYFIPKNISEQIIIPKDSIRFRVIASSDEDSAQELKQQVKNSLNRDIASILKDKDTIEESREALINNLDTIESNVFNTLKKNNSNETFKVNYGNNYFPSKTFKGVTYPEGEYESLVVTLGKGEGKNWWCVLFPPLCLLEADESKQEDVEYKFFVQEIIEKFSK